jgi:hypothetical protein
MKDIRPMLRRMASRLGTQTALAYQLGIHPAYLNDVLNGRRDPGPAILEPLGYERVVIYRRKRVAA